jgi:hypothetical protein
MRALHTDIMQSKNHLINAFHGFSLISKCYQKLLDKINLKILSESVATSKLY